MNTGTLTIQSQPGRPSLQLGCQVEIQLTPERRMFLAHLETLFGSPVRILDTQNLTGEQNKFKSMVARDSQGLDLLVYWEPRRNLWQRCLGLVPSIDIVSQARSSVLVVRNPRQPIQRILLVLRQHESDRAALDWLARLVTPNRTEVFVLPIVPAIPAMYRFYSLPFQAELPLDSLIADDFRSLLSGLFAAWRVHGTLLLHNGTPLQRIEWATACEYDLAVISGEPFPKYHRRLLGEIERPLLKTARRPVLIAKKSPGDPGLTG